MQIIRQIPNLGKLTIDLSEHETKEIYEAYRKQQLKQQARAHCEDFLTHLKAPRNTIPAEIPYSILATMAEDYTNKENKPKYQSKSPNQIWSEIIKDVFDSYIVRNWLSQLETNFDPDTCIAKTIKKHLPNYADLAAYPNLHGLRLEYSLGHLHAKDLMPIMQDLCWNNTQGGT